MLVVGDLHVEGPENLRKFLLGGRRDGLAQVRHGVEHRQDFVGMMPGGPLLLECFQRVRDGCLAGAQLNYAFGGERDDWMVGVLVLLKPERLSAKGAVDLAQLALQALGLCAVLLPRWFADAAEVQAALERFDPAGDVLELACGTGLWTQRLTPRAGSVTAIDGSPEMIELCRARVNDPCVQYVQADLFAWEPDRTYDVCFFGFWLSHVPEDRFEAFWEKVRRVVGPKGRVFFIDSLRSKKASAVDHKLPDQAEETMLRRLTDGREYRIVKRFHEPEPLQQRLTELGWSAQVQRTPGSSSTGGPRQPRSVAHLTDQVLVDSAGAISRGNSRSNSIISVGSGIPCSPV
jgi:ubiquinone/menaquinone biosynthesis C-methylase UbiE